MPVLGSRYGSDAFSAARQAADGNRQNQDCNNALRMTTPPAEEKGCAGSNNSGVAGRGIRRGLTASFYKVYLDFPNDS